MGVFSTSDFRTLSTVQYGLTPDFSHWLDSPIKRIFDIIIVLVSLPLVLPVILLCYLVVKLDGGPGFFSQKRIGRGGDTFRMYKLRSMVTNADTALLAYLQANPEAADEWRDTQKLRNDPRITRVGRFLRKTSLDELPQIFNVLAGDMSIVGPRPVIKDELGRYGDHNNAYLSARPGITGLWQVSGRNDVSYEEKVQLDYQYAMKSSLFVDLSIVLRTFRAVLQQTGY